MSYLKTVKRALSRPVRLQNSSGFTMVEVLVALVILSVGLLGLAGIQTTGLQGNRGALMRSQAIQSGADILDRMRANRVVAVAGGYDMTAAQGPGTSGASGLALTDLGEWMTGLQGNLPAGDGAVAVVGNIATITITWSDVMDNNTITVVSRL